MQTCTCFIGNAIFQVGSFRARNIWNYGFRFISKNFQYTKSNDWNKSVHQSLVWFQSIASYHIGISECKRVFTVKVYVYERWMHQNESTTNVTDNSTNFPFEINWQSVRSFIYIYRHRHIVAQTNDVDETKNYLHRHTCTHARMHIAFHSRWYHFSQYWWVEQAKEIRVAGTRADTRIHSSIKYDEK